MRPKVTMRAMHVTDNIVVKLIVQYNPGGWHDYYDVEVSRLLYDGIFELDPEAAEEIVTASTWVRQGSTSYREYQDALLAFEQKQRDIAAEIILGEQ